MAECQILNARLNIFFCSNKCTKEKHATLQLFVCILLIKVSDKSKKLSKWFFSTISSVIKFFNDNISIPKDSNHGRLAKINITQLSLFLQNKRFEIRHYSSQKFGVDDSPKR